MTDEHRDGNPEDGSPSQEGTRPTHGGPPRRRRGRRGYEGQPEWKDARAGDTQPAASEPAAPAHDERTFTREERTVTREDRTFTQEDRRVTRDEPPAREPVQDRPERSEPAFGSEASPGGPREEPRRERFRRRGGRRSGVDRGRRPDDARPDEPRRDGVERVDARREDTARDESRRDEMRPPEGRRDEMRRDEARPSEGRRDEMRRDEARPPEGRRDEMRRDEVRPPEGRRDEMRRDEPRREESRRDSPRRDDARHDARRSRGPRREEPRPESRPEEPSRGDRPPRDRDRRGHDRREQGSRGDTPRELRRDRLPQERHATDRPQPAPHPPRENERPSAGPRSQPRPQGVSPRRNEGPRGGGRGRDSGRRDSRGPRTNASMLADHPLKPTSVLTLPPKPIRVMIVGGGTGGHITPALSIGEALKARNPQTELLFVGSDRGLEREMIGKSGFRLEEFSLSGLPSKPSLGAFKQALQVLKAYQRIKRLIGEFKPDVIVGTGGYVTVPGALAAKTSRVPLVLQEQNSIPGKANRLLSRWAAEVHIHFTESRRYFKDRGKLRLSGNPVRIRIPEGRGLKTLQKYRLHPERKTVLILGGSQGAHSLNQAFIDMLPHFRNDRDVQFVIQTGKQDYDLVLNSVRDSAVRVVVKSFLHQIEEIYGVTSLVLARAGAMTVSEISACGLASILVPYPHAADDHQTANARALSDKGAALLLRDQDVSGERLAQEIRKLLADPGHLREMGRFAYALSRPDAARRIAESVERLGGGAPEAVLNLPEEYDEIEEAEAKH